MTRLHGHRHHPHGGLGGPLRVGIVCPYDWQVPGGVQVHVEALAESLLARGHDVSVLAPADDDATGLPPWLVPAGRAIPVPFNGSVARVRVGPGAASRVRSWLRHGGFDVVHVHEPLTPGLALATTRTSTAPVVGTFHAAAEQGFALTLASTILRTTVMRMDRRIVVSAAARATLAALVDDDVEADEIPNFIDTRGRDLAPPIADLRGADGTIVFLGRTDEPRKGLAVLLDAVPALLAARPHLRILIAGPGDEDELADSIDWHHRHQVRVLGVVDEPTKRSLFTTADVYVAPNMGGESFGIVLLEAMSAGTPVVASDLDAFAAVLEHGRSGRLFRRGDADALAGAVLELLDDPQSRARLAHEGMRRARDFDRETVVDRIESVYAEVVGKVDDTVVHVRAERRRARIAARAARRAHH